MERLSQKHDPNLLIGFGTSDDAGVYRLTDDIAIVTTVDFITPPVDDPFLYGQIAAANAIGDVYAMGGRPVTCLNLAGFPVKKLGLDILHKIVAGALDKITEADAVLAGGHTVEDDEPKFGLAVTGTVHPDKIWANSGARPGDMLILTKPLGTGVLFNANLKGRVTEKAMAECTKVASWLNKKPAGIMADFDIHAVTDITGFGLAGHALEMAEASKATLEIDLDSLPVLPEALDMYKNGVTTGMNRSNQLMVEAKTGFEKEPPSWHKEILYDPQTSGGLLIAVPENAGKNLLEAFKENGLSWFSKIGKVSPLKDSAYLIFK